MNIEGLGPAIVELLLQNNLIASPADLCYNKRRLAASPCPAAAACTGFRRINLLHGEMELS